MENQEAKVLPSFELVKEVEAKSGQPVGRCYQCKKCTGGCPMSFAFDLFAHQIVRYVQLGLKEPLLKSKSIWICACCKTCKSRCPNGIDISALNDTLKAMALKESAGAAEGKVAAFHDAFVSSVERYGRVHEAGMLARYKLKTKTYTQDMSLGIEFIKRRKLKLLPEKVRQLREIKQIFQRAKEKSQ
ncbi:4Fe-4S dicluster domain-containing protein [Calderihabitans maritimus]|uniref:Heterodisulfide reductase subunit C n=1 Tax=Calderihabitans maritimus TaxID=1246530 RepID=A0A1Z5HR91_9FIRM|nr:4Fe-4S dicluster domain-containing protein [Calderihabitans maritimus]GAW91841.1 heterodisulfide reductase subunit C [Calderihabitans maritimus]